MLVAVSMMATVVLILVFLFVQDKPPTPPPQMEQLRDPRETIRTTSEMSDSDLKPEMSLKALTKQLIGDRDFMLQMTSTSLVFTYWYIYATVFGQLILPFGYESVSYVELLGILFNLLGIVGAVIAALMVGKNIDKLKVAAVTVIFLTTASACAFLVALMYGGELAVTITNSIIGFFNLCIIMIGYELSVAQALRINPQIGEALSCGMINLTANTLGFFVIIALTPVLNKNHEDYSIYI